MRCIETVISRRSTLPLQHTFPTQIPISIYFALYSVLQQGWILSDVPWYIAELLVSSRHPGCNHDRHESIYIIPGGGIIFCSTNVHGSRLLMSAGFIPFVTRNVTLMPQTTAKMPLPRQMCLLENPPKLIHNFIVWSVCSHSEMLTCTTELLHRAEILPGRSTTVILSLFSPFRPIQNGAE